MQLCLFFKLFSIIFRNILFLIIVVSLQVYVKNKQQLFIQFLYISIYQFNFVLSPAKLFFFVFINLIFLFGNYYGRRDTDSDSRIVLPVISFSIFVVTLKMKTLAESRMLETMRCKTNECRRWSGFRINIAKMLTIHVKEEYAKIEAVDLYFFARDNAC